MRRVTAHDVDNYITKLANEGRWIGSNEKSLAQSKLEAWKTLGVTDRDLDVVDAAERAAAVELTKPAMETAANRAVILRIFSE